MVFKIHAKVSNSLANRKKNRDGNDSAAIFMLSFQSLTDVVLLHEQFVDALEIGVVVETIVDIFEIT